MRNSLIYLSLLLSFIARPLPSLCGQEIPPGWRKFELCHVKAEHSVDVDATESGLIRQLFVDENEWIVKGSAIADLDTALIETRLKMAQLKHELAKILAGDDEQIEFCKLALEEAKIELENRLAIKNRVSSSEIRKADLEVKRREVDLKLAEKARDKRIAESRIQAAEVENLQMHLNRHRIRAPMQGAIVKLAKHSGQWLDVGETIATLVDLESLMIDQLVPRQNLDLSRVVGSRVIVLAGDKSDPVKLSGQIASYDPQESSQGAIRIHARVRNLRRKGEWVLLPGGKVSMYVELDQRDKLKGPELASPTAEWFKY